MSHYVKIMPLLLAGTRSVRAGGALVVNPFHARRHR